MKTITETEFKQMTKQEKCRVIIDILSNKIKIIGDKNEN